MTAAENAQAPWTPGAPDAHRGERLAQARAWLRQDPDPETRDELAGIITRAAGGDPAALAELDDRFGSRLAFGTAGLRGELAAGPRRMNRVLVSQAAAGLAAYLSERASADHGAVPAVVIGYDGRKNSRRFALDSAEVFAGAGLRAILLPRMLPTPVLAFAVRHLGAAAGVMVTASHNPPLDNGYKVYLGGDDDGAQIVPPSDAEIAAHIEKAAAGDIRDLPRSTDYDIADEEVVRAYISATAAVAPAPESAAGLTWVYTALHGVGWKTLSAVVSQAGYPAPLSVLDQRDPDPTFRTVAFPNPEEPGAMDLALARAKTIRAELVIANDPDADRVSVAIPDERADGGWRQLTGNEVGLLLGWRSAQRAAATQSDASLACSLVSSPGLRAIATHYGLGFHETLTGFKWISRAPGLIYGFEEALGYLVNPETVRDKDGISAAVAILELASQARGRGTSLAGLLEELAELIGWYASGQVSLRVDDLSVIDTVMASLRENPPAQIGPVSISGVDDLLAPGGDLPSGNVLRYTLADGARVIVRPSGTEPKLKVYLDARADSAEAAAEAARVLESGVRTLLDERRT